MPNGMPEQTLAPVCISAAPSFAAAPLPLSGQSQSQLKEGQLFARKQNQLQVLRELCVPGRYGELCISCLIACAPYTARWELFPFCRRM